MKEKLGIICATPDELAPYLEALEEGQINSRSGLEFRTGLLAGRSAAMLVSGVCKVNAAIAAVMLSELFEVTHMVYSGVAGGMDPKLKIFDTVVSAYCAYHDVLPAFLTDYPPYLEGVSFPSDSRLIACCKYAVEQTSLKESVYFGGVVTGETFIEHEGREEIIKRFNPLCVDMESAAAAHVCRLRDIPFIAVRTISDTGDESGIEVFEENCRKGARKSFNVAMAMINAM